MHLRTSAAETVREVAARSQGSISHGPASPVRAKAPKPIQPIVLVGLAMWTYHGGGARGGRLGTVLIGQYLMRGRLHPFVLGPAPPFPRRPPRAQHIRGLAVDAVRGVPPQRA